MTYAGLEFVFDEKTRERISAALGASLLDQNPRMNPVTVVRVASRMTDHLEVAMHAAGIIDVTRK
jgi:hypothetical protein